MSEIMSSSKPTRSNLYGGIVVDIAEDSLDHVSKVLVGIPGGVQKAVGSALARAAAAGKTEAKKPVAQMYNITTSQFLQYTRNINNIQRSSGSGVSVNFGFAGYVIPLMQFSTTVSSNGLVSTQVKRGVARETLNHAFQATMGGHTGIYERIGPDRFPVKELYGPATPQMIYTNEEVMDAVEEKMADTYEKRIDHEILRVLNGW